MRKIVFILALFFSSTCSVNAQQKEYIYKDSALKELAPAPLEETTTESNTVNQEAEDKPDTLLYYYPSEIIADTIIAWKKGKAFAYANYLDSLLKEAKNKKKRSTPILQHASSIMDGATFFLRYCKSDILDIGRYFCGIYRISSIPC